MKDELQNSCFFLFSKHQKLVVMKEYWGIIA